jgi:hypothetical protein
MQKRVCEKINTDIRDNELATCDWALNPLAWELYWFVDLFNIAFFKGEPVPTPVLTFERSRVNSLGYYRIGFNDFAVKNQINLNRIYLDRPLYETLQTLVHEMVHSWEHIYVPEEKRTKNWYHTKAFRTKLAGIGILTDEKGCHLGIGDPFAHLLRQHAVSLNGEKRNLKGLILIPPTKKPKGKSKLKKWSCGCQNVRVGKSEFYATCNLCGNRFEIAD